MTIELQNIIPHTLRDKINPKSDIWDKEIIFRNDCSYLIHASSGSGKSTFTNILYGIRKDYTGDVLFDGESIKNSVNNDLSHIRNHKISVVFQDLRLFTELTAEENILINSTDKSALNPQQKEWSKQLGIEVLLHKKTELLSYGERQRVAILRALSQPFEFLILDEPFSHLDKENAQKAYAIIETERKKNEAGLIITSLGNEDFLDTSKKDLL